MILAEYYLQDECLGVFQLLDSIISSLKLRINNGILVVNYFYFS